jgi:HEAT repeat protein
VSGGLGAADAAERLAAITALAERGHAEAAELEALGGCLGHERKAVQRRAAEVFARLAAADPRAAAALRTALADGDPRRRWAAAYALSLDVDPPAEIVPVLLETMASTDGDLRWAAAAIVVRVGERLGLEDALCALARTGTAPGRKMALYCLRDLGARGQAVERLVMNALADADAGVRLAALSTLARLALDREAAARRLIEVLATAAAPERRAAAAALGTLGVQSPAVAAALGTAAASDDPALRRAAGGALRRLAPAHG